MGCSWAPLAFLMALISRRREKFALVMSDITLMSEFDLRDNVGLIVILRYRAVSSPGPAEQQLQQCPAIAVANTHLIFNPKRGDIKVHTSKQHLQSSRCWQERETHDSLFSSFLIIRKIGDGLSKSAKQRLTTSIEGCFGVEQIGRIMYCPLWTPIFAKMCKSYKFFLNFDVSHCSKTSRYRCYLEWGSFLLADSKSTEVRASWLDFEANCRTLSGGPSAAAGNIHRGLQ